jgi:hypothetical protein
MSTIALALSPATRPGFDPVLAGLAGALALTAAALLAAMAVDGRMLDGENVWLKPLKFALSLSLYAATLALYARWLPLRLRQARAMRLFTLAVAAAIVLEMVWVTAAAWLGVRSHYNEAPAWGTIYELMGVLAVFLTSASLVYGIAFWRSRDGTLAEPVRLALAFGLIATFVLTLVSAGTLAAIPPVPAEAHTPVWPVLGWSTAAGDLRVSHFFATHALHAIPLAGIAAAAFAKRHARAIVAGATAVYVSFVALTYVEALADRSFLSTFGF